jgi:hypothetical protein
MTRRWIRRRLRARRGLSDLQGQLGTQQARDVTDYALAQQDMLTNYQLGQLALDYSPPDANNPLGGRRFQDRTTQLTQAQREQAFFGQDVNAMKAFQASGSGWDPPQRPANEFVSRRGCRIRCAAGSGMTSVAAAWPGDGERLLMARVNLHNSNALMAAYHQSKTIRAATEAAACRVRASDPRLRCSSATRRRDDRAGNLDDGRFRRPRAGASARAVCGDRFKRSNPYRQAQHDSPRRIDRGELMAKKKTRLAGRRFADDAALQAIVRYEPEESGLKALAQQARADYGVSVRQAQTTGDLTLQAAREAIPSVANIYDRAGLDQAKTASLVSPELAALSGPGAATLQRGGALEVAQQLGNLRAAKAAALEDLNTRAVAARQGQQYGILNARQKFSADMAKILGQSQSLQRQKGAFTASTINSLLQSSLERQLSARNNARTTRTQGELEARSDAAGAQQPALERHRPGHGEADPRRQARPEGAGQEAEVADTGAARRGEGSGVVDPVVDPSEQGGLRVAA